MLKKVLEEPKKVLVIPQKLPEQPKMVPQKVQNAVENVTEISRKVPKHQIREPKKVTDAPRMVQEASEQTSGPPEKVLQGPEENQIQYLKFSEAPEQLEKGPEEPRLCSRPPEQLQTPVHHPERLQQKGSLASFSILPLNPKFNLFKVQSARAGTADCPVMLSNCSLLFDLSLIMWCLMHDRGSWRSVDAEICFFCLLFLSARLVFLATLPWRNSWVFLLPLKQAGCIHAEEIGAKIKQVVLLTEEVKTLECRVELRESVEDSFLKMKARHPRVSEEPPENLRSALTEDKAEVRREERPLSSSPLTSHMPLSGFAETLLLKKTVVHNCLAAQELQQQDAWSNYADKRGDCRGDRIAPQKGDHHHMTHLSPDQKATADLSIDTFTLQDLLKMDHEDSAQLRRPVSTEVPPQPPGGVKTAAVLLVPAEDHPPGEAKLLPAFAEDERAQRNQPCQAPQEKKPVFTLEASQMKKTAPPEQKLKLSEEIWSSTTTAVAVPSSGGQRRVGSTLDIEGQSLHGGPQSGLSCSGSLHKLSSYIHTLCMLSSKSS